MSLFSFTIPPTFLQYKKFDFCFLLIKNYEDYQKAITVANATLQPRLVDDYERGLLIARRKAEVLKAQGTGTGLPVNNSIDSLALKDILNRSGPSRGKVMAQFPPSQCDPSISFKVVASLDRKPLRRSTQVSRDPFDAIQSLTSIPVSYWSL